MTSDASRMPTRADCATDEMSRAAAVAISGVNVVISETAKKPWGNSKSVHADIDERAAVGAVGQHGDDQEGDPVGDHVADRPT